jgi:peptide/nickel transport system substrate-binding protein
MKLHRWKSDLSIKEWNMRKAFIALASAVAFIALSSATPVSAQGTLRVALPSNVNTLDPAKTKIGEEYIINFLV